MAKAEETITWGGRLIVGGAVLYIAAMVTNDHDSTTVLKEHDKDHEKRISNLEGNKKQVSLMTYPIEAILPTELKLENEK